MKNLKKNGGFTLVELIVVIAILAILAAVAVPAYSGYIEKANEAGDQQLLAAVNKAFASACAFNGEDNYFRTDITASNAKISEGKFDYTGPFAEDFAAFFEGNADSMFNTLTTVMYDPALGAFVDPLNADSVTVNYKGSFVTLSGSALKALKESTYGTKIGTNALLDKINDVTDVAASMAGSLDAVFNDLAFKQCAMQALGATTAEEYATKQEELIQQLIGQGLTREQAEGKLAANAAVLYASQSAVNFTDDQLTALFSTTGSTAIKNNLKGTGTGTTSEGMAQAALVYGMYTAYANSDEYGSDTLRANAENPLAVLNALEDDENFIKFVNSKQGKSDMSAYMSSLGVIVDSTSNNPDAVADIMVNGYNNDALKDIMSGLIG